MTHFNFGKLQTNFSSKDTQWTQCARCDCDGVWPYFLQLLKRELWRETSNLNLPFTNVLFLLSQIFVRLCNLHKEFIKVVLIVQQVIEPFIKSLQIYYLETLFILFHKIFCHKFQGFNNLFQSLFQCLVHKIMDFLRKEYILDVFFNLLSVWSVRKTNSLPMMGFLLVNWFGWVYCLEEGRISLFEIHPLLLKINPIITLRICNYSSQEFNMILELGLTTFSYQLLLIIFLLNHFHQSIHFLIFLLLAFSLLL